MPRQRRVRRRVAKRTNFKRRNPTAILKPRNMKPKADPKPVNLQRWYPLTIQFRSTAPDTSNLTITSALLEQLIVNQIKVIPVAADGVTRSDFLIRLQSIKVHDLASRPISLGIFDLSEGGYGALTNQSDYPGRNHWSAVGAVWSAKDQAIPIETTLERRLAVIAVGESLSSTTNSNHVLVAINLLFRSRTESLTEDPVPAALQVHTGLFKQMDSGTRTVAVLPFKTEPEEEIPCSDATS